MTAGFPADRELVLSWLREVPFQKVFRGWTDPRLITRWFTPPPWITTNAELDVRPGGANLSDANLPGGANVRARHWPTTDREHQEPGRISRDRGEAVMSTSANTITSFGAAPALRRRALLGMMLIATAPLSRHALAATAPADAIETIKHFNQALLGAMKTGGKSDFGHRFEALAPEVDQAFDLPAVLSVSVGPGWASLSSDQQNRLLDAFRRYTVASYLANFDSYAGQSLTVSPETRSLGAGQVVVQSRIVPVSGDATELDYVMRQTSAGWKVVDVMAAGSISRVAVQRSDFRHVLSHGGGDALVATLQRKTSDLSAGALA
jgi:phospholipid transport system substrate-binding protein